MLQHEFNPRCENGMREKEGRCVYMAKKRKAAKKVAKRKATKKKTTKRKAAKRR